MPIFGKAPFENIVEQATKETNDSEDWALILEICDKAINYEEEGPKFCLQAINKRLYNSVPRVVMSALILLDACVQNCGKPFHLEVASRNFVSLIPKLLSKMPPAPAEKFKELIKKWAENEFKDVPELGLIPSLYYKMKSEGVTFPEPEVVKTNKTVVCTNPDAVSSQEEEEDIIKAIELSLHDTKLHTFSSGFQDPDLAPKIEPVRCRALYDFEAAEDNELTIKTGEIIVVTERSNENWWKGSNHRGEGYFPMNFVTENLDAQIEDLTVTDKVVNEDSVELTLNEALEIDENKMMIALNWLNEVDPTDEDIEDPKEMLHLECECSSMVTLVEKELELIDKKLTRLNTVNNDIMAAVELYYKLTRESMEQNMFLNYTNEATHAVQVPKQIQGSTMALPSLHHSSSLPSLALSEKPAEGPSIPVSVSYSLGTRTFEVNPALTNPLLTKHGPGTMAWYDPSQYILVQLPPGAPYTPPDLMMSGAPIPLQVPYQIDNDGQCEQSKILLPSTAPTTTIVVTSAAQSTNVIEQQPVTSAATISEQAGPYNMSENMNAL